MKSKEIDIEQFNTIEELYSFVDKNAYNIERNWDLTDIWVKYRNKTKDEEEKQKAQWEINCLLFDVKGKIPFSLTYSEAKMNGEVKGFPDLNDFQIEVIEYVKLRAENSSNPILKARYNHLLWKSPVGIKKNQFAVLAIHNYINAINKYCEFYRNDQHKETSHIIGRLFETLLAVSNDIKFDPQPVKELANNLLLQSYGFEFYLKHGILDDMLKYPKLFKPSDFKDSLSIFDEEISKDKDKSDDFLLVNYHIHTAIKIASKLKSDVKKWHTKAGLAYLRLAEDETEEDRFWIRQDYHSKAITAFSLAGNKEKRIEAENLYAEFKPKVKLSSFRIEFKEETQKQIKDFFKYAKNIAESVLKHSPDDVYRTISSGYFFPKYNSVLKATENQGNDFMDFVTTIQFDKNKNISIPQKEALKENKIYDTYRYYIHWCLLPYLNNIFISGIKSGHLTFENLILYLAENSWIGKPLVKYNIGGDEKSINWIGLLSPSIIEFFIQMQGWVSSKYYRPSYVLCVDSLTLKFEGLLRDFCERMGIPMSISKHKGMQEANIQNILDNERIKEFFNEDDLLFFNYLFSAESNLNLRNNVAHCFYDYEEYHPEQMFLLLAALLRLAKYDYKDKTDESGK